jgi:hypothetical protein
MSSLTTYMSSLSNKSRNIPKQGMFFLLMYRQFLQPVPSNDVTNQLHTVKLVLDSFAILPDIQTLNS